MMWGYYDGWGSLWMISMIVLMWGGVAVLIAFAVRTFNGGGHDRSLDVLRRRLASGEITPEEFERTRRLLHGQR